ncbi:MAG: hypothetical protein UHI81_02740 [Olegusella sp.]|nr:hypothetical protein [Olegusella sp.]
MAESTADSIKSELSSRLRSLYDDDYVEGCLDLAGSSENMETMIAFMNRAEEVGDPIISDDMLALALVLCDKSDGTVRSRYGTAL